MRFISSTKSVRPPGAAQRADANASADLYSLIETAKANDIEPNAYLSMFFTELPKATSLDEVEPLLTSTQSHVENSVA